MIKVFISQPIKNRTTMEIMEERQQAIKMVKSLYHDTVEIVNPFHYDQPAQKPLFLLGKNLEFMSSADVAVFVPNWEDYTQCKIEQFCAMEYGIESIEI